MASVYFDVFFEGDLNTQSLRVGDADQLSKYGHDVVDAIDFFSSAFPILTTELAVVLGRVFDTMVAYIQAIVDDPTNAPSPMLPVLTSVDVLDGATVQSFTGGYAGRRWGFRVE